MEIQLAESKFELSSLSDQLMEAIQQKMALSQELEQWQVSQLDKYILWVLSINVVSQTTSLRHLKVTGMVGNVTSLQPGIVEFGTMPGFL